MSLTLWSKNSLRPLKSILPELVSLGIFLFLWQLGAMHYGSIVLPSPIETAIAIKRLATTGKLGDALLTTSFHLLAAFLRSLLLSYWEFFWAL